MPFWAIPFGVSATTSSKLAWIPTNCLFSQIGMGQRKWLSSFLVGGITLEKEGNFRGRVAVLSEEKYP